MHEVKKGVRNSEYKRKNMLVVPEDFFHVSPPKVIVAKFGYCFEIKQTTGLAKACFDLKWICLLKNVFYAVCKYHASHYMFSHIILFWICYIEFVSFWGMVYGARDIYATYIKLGMYIHNIHFCL